MGIKKYISHFTNAKGQTYWFKDEEARRRLGMNNIYGVKFDNGSNSGESVHRLGKSVGLIAEVGTDTQKCKNDFDSIYPWGGMIRCNAKIEGSSFNVLSYKGDPDYKQDGSNGEVWVEIPCFWYKHTYEGDSEEILISPAEQPGFLPSPLAVQFGSKDYPAEKSYIPAYKLAIIADQATSRSGVFSDYGSLNYFMSKTATKNSNTSVTTVAESYTLYLLMVTEFATRDLQSVMRGYSSMPYDKNFTALVDEQSTNRIIITESQAARFVKGCTIGIGTSLGSRNIANNRVVTEIVKTTAGQSAIVFDGKPINIAIGNIVFCLPTINGSCDGVLSSSGSPVSNTDGHHDCIYRGIEAPYANSFSWVADLLFNRIGTENSYKYEIMYLPDISKYSNGTINDNYKKIAYNIPSVNGYVKKFGFDPTYPHVRTPIEVGASSNTYNSDYYYYPRGQVCAAQLGAIWNDGSHCGPSYWYCTDSPAYSDLDSRARHSFHR